MNKDRKLVIMNDEGSISTLLLTEEQLKLIEWMKKKNLFYDTVDFVVQPNQPEII